MTDENKGEGKPDESAKQIETLTQQLTETAEELERFKAKHAEAEKHRKQAEKEAQKRVEEAAKKSGDTEALEKSWTEKLTAREQELQAEINRRDGWLKEMTVGRTAESMAAELAVQGSAVVLARHIQDRLSSEIRDGRPVTVVLDTEGKPSAKTLDELKAEFSGNAAFAPLIAGNKASGSGGIHGKGGAQTGLDRRTMSIRQRAEFIDKHGNEAYEKLPKSDPPKPKEK